MFIIRLGRFNSVFGLLLLGCVPLIGGAKYLRSAFAPGEIGGRAYDFTLGALLILIGLGCIALFIMLLSRKAEVFERGIVQTELGKKIAIRFDEVTAVNRYVLDVRNRVVRQTAVNIRTADGRVIGMLVQTTTWQTDANLDTAFRMAANVVGQRMERKLQANGSVAWLKDEKGQQLSIRRDGLVAGGQFVPFAGMKSGADNGRWSLSAGGKTLFEISAAEFNFYPGLEIMKRLSGGPPASTGDSSQRRAG